MVTKLYIKLISTESPTQAKEIDVLYTLLSDMFEESAIGLDVYISKLIKNDIDLTEVINFLKRHLIGLDKLRIILSLIILAYSDNDIDTSEVTTILELAGRFGLDKPSIHKIINYFEHDDNHIVSIPGFRVFTHRNRSIFNDFISFGKGQKQHINFADSKVRDEEVAVIVIDNAIFVATGSTSNARINGLSLSPNHIYTFSSKSLLEIGNIHFNHLHLLKLYKNRRKRDIIEFRKADYDFDIIANKNKYSIIVRKGTVYKNGKELTFNREQPLLFDDVIQIKGYDSFWLNDVIEQREEIGTESLLPDELFISYEEGQYSISRDSSSGYILRLNLKDGDYYVDPSNKKGFRVFINEEELKQPTLMQINLDIITINKKNFRLSSLLDLIEVPFEVDNWKAIDIRHEFEDGNVALDGISFEAKKGELLAIMGLSGCGKSTLLKTISAQIIPKQGKIKIDGKDFYSDLSFFTQYIGFVPQDDLLYPELTVYENLFYRGRLRLPNLPKKNLEQKINNIVAQMKLSHARDTKVGTEKQKMLSGGERKRLNLALELLLEPTIIICDEPTSGLSSTDSEQIIDILKELTSQNKIVITTIHQPNQIVFSKFNRVLIMDTGGKQVFFGKTLELYNYFDAELTEIHRKREPILAKKESGVPDFIFDIIEYPAFRDNGEIIYERKNNSFIVKRKFSPTYWQEKFRRKMLHDLMTSKQSLKVDANPDYIKRRPKLNFKGHLVQFVSLFWRNLYIKLRNRSNIIITFAEAPLLGLIISFILKLAPFSDVYNYYDNVNVGIFLFTSVIVFIFLGLSNSIEDILGERKLILREKKLGIRTRFVVISKVLVLAFFSLIQVLLYYFLAAFILQIKGMFIYNVVYLFFAGIMGYSIGLLLSTFIHNNKAIVNLLPLILIPQIIFGGAIIQYDKMNRNLKVFKNSPVPEVVQIMPSKWLFEGLYTGQAHLNKLDKELDALDKKRLTLNEKYHSGLINFTKFNEHRYEIMRQKGVVAKKYPKRYYKNDDICLVTSLMDGKFLNKNKNIFLSSYKKFGKYRFRTYYFNLIVSLLYILILNIATYVRLRYFYYE